MVLLAPSRVVGSRLITLSTSPASAVVHQGQRVLFSLILSRLPTRFTEEPEATLMRRETDRFRLANNCETKIDEDALTYMGLQGEFIPQPNQRKLAQAKLEEQMRAKESQADVDLQNSDSASLGIKDGSISRALDSVSGSSLDMFLQSHDSAEALNELKGPSFDLTEKKSNEQREKYGARLTESSDKNAYTIKSDPDSMSHLIVKYKGSNVYTFPYLPYTRGLKLSSCIDSLVEKVSREKADVHMLGLSPAGCRSVYTLDPTYEGKSASAKVFYFRGLVNDASWGIGTLGPVVESFKWVPRKHLQDFLSEDCARFVCRILPLA